MNMYVSSAKYRDACESGKVIYSSFYRTLLMLNKVLLKEIDLKNYFAKYEICEFVLYGCNDVTELFLELCNKYKIKPIFFIDDNPKKNKEKYSQYSIFNCEILAQKKDIDLIVVMSNYNFNEVAEKIHSYGIEYSRIISIEELLANIICCNN